MHVSREKKSLRLQHAYLNRAVKKKMKIVEGETHVLNTLDLLGDPSLRISIWRRCKWKITHACHLMIHRNKWELPKVRENWKWRALLGAVSEGLLLRTFTTLKAAAVKVQLQSSVRTLPWELSRRKWKPRPSQAWGLCFLRLCVQSAPLPPWAQPQASGLCACVFHTEQEKVLQAAMCTDTAQRLVQGSPESRWAGPSPAKFTGPSSVCSERDLSYSAILAYICKRNSLHFFHKNNII